MKQREIKFRAYHKIQKRMFEVYGLGLDFVTENTLDGVSPGDNAWQGDELKNIEIMQFTGLTDKNGKEVFEGDMISLGDGKATIEYSNQDFCFVFWHNIDEEWYSLAYLKGLKNFEIIGNIHEHKHLLK